jgi:hypothetical protein
MVQIHAENGRQQVAQGRAELMSPGWTKTKNYVERSNSGCSDKSIRRTVGG